MTVPEAVAYVLLRQLLLIVFPILGCAVFIVWLTFLRKQQGLGRITPVAYLAVVILQLGTWGVLLYETFYDDLDGRKRCETGEMDEESGRWVLENTSYTDFLDCNADQDMLLAFDYAVILAIICVKFFFSQVVWEWSSTLLPNNDQDEEKANDINSSAR